MASKFLKQAVTGRIYLYSEHLANRKDMFPVDEEDVPVAMGGLKQPKPAKPESEETKVPVVSDEAPKAPAAKGKKDAAKGEGSAE